MFTLGSRVERILLWPCTPGDPTVRPLQVFTLDPTVSALDGAIATLRIPYEPLPEAGPRGCVFTVDGDGPLELDSPRVLISSGLPPSTTDPRFRHQMAYAVASHVYHAFRRALGRAPVWTVPGPLTLRPHVPDLANAYYEPRAGAIVFGSYLAPPQAGGGIPPGAQVHTALSHDIIAHEVTHALLDGLRSHFLFPSNPDVLAFHEAFADLVALFQHFTYPDVVETQIRQYGSALLDSPLLAGLAREFGFARGSQLPLRSLQPDAIYGQHTSDPYAHGGVLVAAVFEAFATVFDRKTAALRRIAGQDISSDLVTLLAAQAASLARQFLNICIRAVDYCPPVDITFGEYLRALITADRDLFDEDPWGYREALIRAFARRRIFPPGVPNLSEEALLWDPPRGPLPPIAGLRFGNLRFDGDPASPADSSELRRQAHALGEFLTQPDHLPLLGLAPAGPDFEPPCVQSIRSARRSADGRILFDLVAEVTQRRVGEQFYGGVTLLIGPDGRIRYTVLKSVTQQQRREAQQGYRPSLGPEIFRHLHQNRHAI